MDERAGVAAPPGLRELLELVFERVEVVSGWRLTEGHSATLEIVRDGSGYTIYGKGKLVDRDLDDGH